MAELVEAFFRADDAAKRAKLVSSIEQAANGSVGAVVQAVQTAPLWSALPEGGGRFTFESESGNAIDITYHLPAGYDSTSRCPMIVCMPDDRATPTDTLALAGNALGALIDGFVLIAPAQPIGGAFHQPVEETADLRRLMRAIRRLIHIDTDRVFLFGIGAGGDAAWMAAIAQPDLFAGVIVLASYPHVPYAEQTYRILLENLRRLPVLTAWAFAEEPGVTARERAVADHNRAIAVIAEQASLPITGWEGSHGAFRGLGPPKGRLATILRGRRAPLSRSVSHWFRYPAHGAAEWVRQAGFSGDVWEEHQLSILASPTTDRNAFITEVIKGKMAYVGGRINGQRIEIEARRCARVELLLPDGLVDFDQPITVQCNGKKRFHGLVRPDIRTLLETAYRRWEFQRLTLARLSFSVKPKAP